MKFDKYSAIYRNDNLTINDEEIIGKVKDVKEYLRYELASQCMSDINYENLVDNADMIIDLIQELDETQEDTLKIKVYYNPMGGLYYKDYKEEE